MKWIKQTVDLIYRLMGLAVIYYGWVLGNALWSNNVEAIEVWWWGFPIIMIYTGIICIVKGITNKGIK